MGDTPGSVITIASGRCPAAIGVRTRRIEIGTGVIDMRYENPLYMAEEAGAADLLSLVAPSGNAEYPRLPCGTSMRSRKVVSRSSGALAATRTGPWAA